MVTHDAYQHGAQYIALHLVRELVSTQGCEVEVVCLGGGPLASEFAAFARLHDLTGFDHCGTYAANLARDLYVRGFRHAFVNTLVGGRFLSTLKAAGLTCVSLVHEMRELARAYGLEPHAQAISRDAHAIVFPAFAVRDSITQFAALDEGKVFVRPQGLFKQNPYTPGTVVQARERLRALLRIPPASRILLGVGFADHRKGVDWFADIALLLAAIDPLIHCVWAGRWEGNIRAAVDARLQREPGGFRNLHSSASHVDTAIYYAGADVFALTSREDPFPSVVLEAMDMGLPVVAFAGSGGSNSLIEAGVGINVPMGDTSAFARAVADFLHDEALRESTGRRARAIIRERFFFQDYAADLLGIAGVLPGGTPRYRRDT